MTAEERTDLIASCLDATHEPAPEARTSRGAIQRAVLLAWHSQTDEAWTSEDGKILSGMIEEIGGKPCWHAGMQCHRLQPRGAALQEIRVSAPKIDTTIPSNEEALKPNPIHELPPPTCPPTCPNVNQTSQDTIQDTKSPHGANGRPTATVLSRPVIRIRLDGLQLSDHETLALALLVQVGHQVSLDIQILLERFLAACQRHRGLDVEIPGDPVMEPDVVIEP